MEKNQSTGVVIKATSGFYYIRSGHQVIACKLRGRMKQSRYSVCVGDHVQFSFAGETDGSIEAILPRNSFLHRPEVANVDQAVLTFAAQKPQFDPALLDRFLVLAELSAIPAIICINKIDLVDPAEMLASLSMYEKVGYKILAVSTVTGQGIDALHQLLCDKVTVFAGPSGVGKSSLLNAFEAGLALTTGELSQKISRGRHTTRCAELLPLSCGGYVVDTPGFSFTEFLTMAPEELRFHYWEFRDRLADCHFSSCLHQKEPRCAVKQAVTDGEIARSRYDSYLALLLELQETYSRRF